ncbi:MAG: hypothetical protein ACXVWU_07585 [Nocardioides sp.]
MTNEIPENDLDVDELVGEAPAGDASPEDYMSNDQSRGVSEDTGTIYDAVGEPEATPHDLEPEDDEDEE